MVLPNALCAARCPGHRHLARTRLCLGHWGSKGLAAIQTVAMRKRRVNYQFGLARMVSTARGEQQVKTSKKNLKSNHVLEANLAILAGRGWLCPTNLNECRYLR